MEYSSGCTTPSSTAVPASVWQSVSAWLNAMAEGSGSNPNPAKGLPFTSPSPGEPRQEERPRFNLLLAEDNYPDVMLVEEAVGMEKLPLDIHTVSDGQQAIDFIARAERDANAPCPDLVLLDLNLPRRSGFEVLRRLRASEKWKSVPVLVITSSDSREDLSEADALGAGYFRKPPNYEEFLKLGAVLKQLLNANR